MTALLFVNSIDDAWDLPLSYTCYTNNWKHTAECWIHQELLYTYLYILLTLVVEDASTTKSLPTTADTSTVASTPASSE